MAHDVFISYSTKDKTIADAVCAKLEEHRIRVWIAPRDVPAGSNFAQSIIRAINNCKVFVLIWSANTNTSNHILNEINQAFDQGITIIPFRIQDIQPTDEMRYYFGRTHWLDAITPPLENHIAVLRDTILVNLGRELQLAKLTADSQEPSEEGIRPSVKPVTMEESAIQQVKAFKPSLKLPRQKKSQKIDTKIKPTVVVPANLTRFIPFAAGGLVVITLVVLLISGVFKGSTLVDVTQTSPAPASSIPPTGYTKPTDTIKPTETITPVTGGIDEAVAFAAAEPILAAIQKFQPDFEDDFSQVDTAWSYNPGDGEYDCRGSDETNMDVIDGLLQSSLGPDCPAAAIAPPGMQYDHYILQWMQYDHYILQLDVHFPGVPLGVEFRNWGRSANDEDVQLHYSLSSPEGHWGLSRNGNLIEGMEGKASLDFSKPVTITIINQSPIFIVYIDSYLITFYNSEEEYGRFGLDFVFSTGDVTRTETLTLELDNIKIWDLDRIEEVNAMAESTLAMINNFPPDFADDFSQVDPNWIAYPGSPDQCPNASDVKMGITDGSMRYSITNCQTGILVYEGMQYGNYVLQMDVNFEQTSGDLLFRMWYPSEEYNELNFGLNPNGWGFGIVDQGRNIESFNGEIDFGSSLVTITIVNKSPTFLVYFDSSLLMSYNDLAEHFGPIGIDFVLSKSESITQVETFELDNVKVWDLDRIEESIAFAESTLAAVQDLPPDFADDFSQVDPNWSSPPGTASHECSNAGDATISITDGSMKYSIINCQVGNLQYEGMQPYTNYVLQLDVNFDEAPLGLEFRDWGPSVQLDYNLQRIEGNWGFGVFRDGSRIEGIDGSVGSDLSEPVTITIINKSPMFIVYIDSSLETLYHTQETYAGPFGLDFTVFNWDFAPTEALTLELDNVKIWDLDKIEEAIAFSESILATVQDLPPDFADDFSQVDPNWFSPPEEAPPGCMNADEGMMSITDGSMKYSILNCQGGSLQYAGMGYANYVLQLDVNFQGAPLGLEFRNWGPSELLDYHLQSPEGHWGFGVFRDSDRIEGMDGHVDLDFSKPATITIINKSPTFVVYLDSSLLTLYNTQETYAGPFGLDFNVYNYDFVPTEALTLEVDNVKIWDLDKIEY
jgi:hypothetical protein